MPVTFDTSNSAYSWGATSLTSASFTIADNANRVGIVFLYFSDDPGEISSVTIGGASASLVSNTDSGNQAAGRTFIYAAVAPQVGASKTASASWANSVGCVIIGMVAYGVDQTTPVNNGTSANGNTSGTPDPASITINSASNELTIDITGSGGGTPSSPTKTSIRETVMAGASRADGAASNTHQWTLASWRSWVASGANLNEYVAPPVGIPINLFRKNFHHMIIR